MIPLMHLCFNHGSPNILSHMHLNGGNTSWLQLNPLFEKHGHLKTVLGHFDTKLLKDADMVVVSPGVPLESHGLSFLLQSVSLYCCLIFIH